MARALWNEHYLRIRYRCGGEIYGRKLGPLGFVLKGGVWYLVAQSGKQARTYRVVQIVEAEALDEPFARPAAFDLTAHWTKSAQDYETELYREHADVRLSPKGMGLLGLLGPYVAEAARNTASKPDRRGWVCCTLPIESIDFGLRELMRLGAEAEVIGPPTLRKAMAATLAAMARRHV
jgi:predicted DNA-binding transcriptional regulator YafY